MMTSSSTRSGWSLTHDLFGGGSAFGDQNLVALAGEQFAHEQGVFKMIVHYEDALGTGTGRLCHL